MTNTKLHTAWDMVNDVVHTMVQSMDNAMVKNNLRNVILSAFIC